MQPAEQSTIVSREVQRFAQAEVTGLILSLIDRAVLSMKFNKSSPRTAQCALLTVRWNSYDRADGSAGA
jgi:hypothetical protein